MLAQSLPSLLIDVRAGYVRDRALERACRSRELAKQLFTARYGWMLPNMESGTLTFYSQVRARPTPLQSSFFHGLG
jgi:hypothetical protein